MSKQPSIPNNLPPGFVDRRKGHERRKRRWFNLHWLLGKGQRRKLRRREDRRRVVLLDHYSPRIFYVIIVILFLSLLDAALTLLLTRHGAVEMNPVMAYFLEKGENTFLYAKYLITAGSLVIVVVLNYVFVRYLRSHVRDLLIYFAGCFAIVVVWELYLVVKYMI